jgi:hypothetical protein
MMSWIEITIGVAVTLVAFLLIAFFSIRPNLKPARKKSRFAPPSGEEDRGQHFDPT